MFCSICGGYLMYVGTLGKLVHLECRDCGMKSTMPLEKYLERTGQTGDEVMPGLVEYHCDD